MGASEPAAKDRPASEEEEELSSSMSASKRGLRSMEEDQDAARCSGGAVGGEGAGRVRRGRGVRPGEEPGQLIP